MAILDDEIQADFEEDARAIAYIREHLPNELLQTFTPKVLQSVIDAAVDYLSSSSDLETEPDEDGCVNIDLEAMAQGVLRIIELPAGASSLLPSDVQTVLELWMDTEAAFED